MRFTTAACDGPGHLLDALADPPSVLWLSRDVGLAGWGEAIRVDLGTGPGRDARAGEAAARLLGGDPAATAFVSLSFDWQEPGSVLVVPEVLVARRGDRCRVTVAGDRPPPRLWAAPAGDAVRQDRVRYAGSSQPDRQWLEAVAAALERIDAGALDKVVLARDYAVWSRTPFDGRTLARRLAAAFPSCFTFLVDGLVGATPELLVRHRGPAVESLVLAGSARRGADAAEDGRIGEGLLASKKDRLEHEYAVASVREVLAPRCADLEVASEPSLLRLSNVVHLATAVRGSLDPTEPGRGPGAGDTALGLAAALHPTAAVGGTPTDAALSTIRALEGMDRGRYAAPVGWVDGSGDGEFGIALRCAQLSGTRARLFAGSGIVAGSLPEAELEETRLKLRAMQGALAARR